MEAEGEHSGEGKMQYRFNGRCRRSLADRIIQCVQVVEGKSGKLNCG